MNLPAQHSDVFTTKNGIPYLKAPGAIMIMTPQVSLAGIAPFLAGFDERLGFGDYLDDPTEIPDAEQLVKFSGQLCYLSLSEKRTWNAEASKYLQHIKESGHGSVLEHANWSFLCYGISRSLTHELVRHRSGASYSQVSQRFVDGSKLRFVERPEWAEDSELHQRFEARIEDAAREYDFLAAKLMAKQEAGDPALKSEGDRRTDLRKRVNQAARACLPNETEAPIVVTLNGRSLRHVLEMRCSAGAEVEIRRLAYILYLLVREVAPILFEDYEIVDLPDGTHALTTKYRKV